MGQEDVILVGGDIPRKEAHRKMSSISGFMGVRRDFGYKLERDYNVLLMEKSHEPVNVSIENVAKNPRVPIL